MVLAQACDTGVVRSIYLIQIFRPISFQRFCSAQRSG